MQAKSRQIRNIVELAAFDHFLRTGRKVDVDALSDLVERKFNPNHDERGRFASGPGGGSSSGNSGPRMSAETRPASRATARSGRSIPLSTQSATTNRSDEIVVTATLESRFDAEFGKRNPHSPKPSQATNETRSQAQLGSLSAYHETGGRGVTTVSTGKGRNGVPDPGGVSYGSYQLTSQTPKIDGNGHKYTDHDGGNVARFLRTEGAQWAGEFAGHNPGSKEFSDAWRRVANRDGAALHAAEHAWVKRENYDPAVISIKASTGVNFNTRHPLVDCCTTWGWDSQCAARRRHKDIYRRNCKYQWHDSKECIQLQ